MTLPKPVVVLGLAGLFAYLTSRYSALAASASEVLALARATIARHDFRVDAVMAAAIAEIESGGNPLALRYEPHIGDASVGLMQTLVSTAQWLWDIGYRDFPQPTMAALAEAHASMYFGCAYLDWLKRRNASSASEEWIVRAYNGGPGGATKPATLPYWQKYKAAKAALIGG